MDSLPVFLAAAVSLAALTILRAAAPARRLAAVAAFAAALLLPAAASAASWPYTTMWQQATAAEECTITWEGDAGSNSWHDPDNWSFSRLPTPPDHVCIFGAGVVRYSDPIDTTVAQLDSSRKLEIAGGHLTFTSRSEVGALKIDGGVFSPNGGLAVLGDGYQTGGEIRTSGRSRCRGRTPGSRVPRAASGSSPSSARAAFASRATTSGSSAAAGPPPRRTTSHGSATAIRPSTAARSRRSAA